MRGSVSQVAAGTIKDDDKVPDPGERPPIAPLLRANPTAPRTTASVRADDPIERLPPSPRADSRAASTRRDFLAAQVVAAVTATQALVPHDAWAAVERGLDLPDDYFKKARDAVKTLVASLEFEATNPSDADRFRKAEPAKEAVKAFIKDWASAPAAQGERAHDDIVLAVRELGEFYKENGSRSRLSPEARESVLAKLYDAREALPPAPPSLADRLLGL